MNIKCNNKIKHFHYLIGKFCKDNNIPVYEDTWNRISKWENNFESTENQTYPYLWFNEFELGGIKILTDSEILNFDEFILQLKDYCKNHSVFRSWRVERIDNKFIFGCGEVQLTLDEIKAFNKIHLILNKKGITLNEDDLKYISNLING